MMDPIDFLEEVETTYDVASIKVNNEQVWSFLRIQYESAYFNKYFLEGPEQEEISPSSKINKIKNSVHGFRNIFKKYDYIIFANKGELRLKNDIYVNILAETLLNYLGKEKTLLIEHPAASRHLPISELSMKNIISLYLFTLLNFLNPFPIKTEIINENILKEINGKYNLNVDYKNKIKKFNSYRILFLIFFKIKKPKLIFISAYSNIVIQAIIHAARTLGIKTIELQHGLINDKHPAYNVYANIEKKSFPEYLLVFGNKIKDTFNAENYFINKNNVFSVGSMYIEFINNDYEISLENKSVLSKFRDNYNKIITVSSQYTVEKELIEFLKKSVSLSNKILFIFIPRDLSKDYSNFNFPKNIVIIKDLDIYQTIKYSDFHATVYSTCALEAPALGIPNILINIKNMSKEYYSEILTNQDVTRFVETPKEFIDLIQTWNTKSKEEIKKLHEGFYAKNHKECLKKALDEIMN